MGNIKMRKVLVLLKVLTIVLAVILFACAILVGVSEIVNPRNVQKIFDNFGLPFDFSLICIIGSACGVGILILYIVKEKIERGK